MKQSWRATGTETFLDVLSGYVVSVAVQWWLFHLYSIHVTFGDNLIIVAIFTVISIIRKLIWRRLFEHFRIKGHLQ